MNDIAWMRYFQHVFDKHRRQRGTKDNRGVSKKAPDPNQLTADEEKFLEAVDKMVESV